MSAPADRKTMAEIGEALTACRHDNCKQVMRKAMTDLVGQDGRHSYETLADLIDVEERTLKGYALGECLPSLPIFLPLCAAGGSDFTNQFLQLIGQQLGIVAIPLRPAAIQLRHVSDSAVLNTAPPPPEPPPPRFIREGVSISRGDAPLEFSNKPCSLCGKVHANRF